LPATNNIEYTIKEIVATMTLEMPDIQDFRIKERKAFKSIKWNYLASILPRMASPISMIILARLLSPKDFGMLATSAIITSFVSMLSTGGLAETIIQVSSGKLKNVANTLFWINLCLTTLFYCVVFIFSGRIAHYFATPELSAVLKIHGLIILFNGWSYIHIGILKRGFEFKKISYLAIIPVTVNFLLAIPLAYYGYGYWALIWSSVVSSFLSLILYFLFSGFKPSFSFSFHESKGSINFGVIILLEGILGWMFNSLDTGIVAKRLSIDDVGIYNFAKNLINVSTGIVLMPLFSIAYSYFSRVNEYTPESIPSKLSKFVKFLSLIVLPMIVFACFLPPSAFPVLFSSKWDSSIIIFQLFSISQISWIFMIFPEAFKSIGKPVLLLPINIIQTVFTIGVLYFSIRYGLTAFVASRILTMWIFGFHIYYARKYLNYRSFVSDTGKYFLFSILMAFSLFIFNSIMPHTSSNKLLLVSNITIGLFVYSILLSLFARQDIVDLVKLKHRL
jgi:O-antigen/teichoic acid export membrane protein